MSFFNSKEEVIDIELTSYGKLLLSRGILKPVYYSFHDDDILYDSRYGGIIENASSAEVRIQEETPYNKTFYSFASPEITIQKAIDQENFLESINNLNNYRLEYFSNYLNDSSVSNLYLPSWRIKNLSTTFNSIETTFGDNLKIPQFNCTLSSSLYKIPQSKIDLNPSLNSLIRMDNSYTTDDSLTVYYGINEPLVLKIEEDNVDVDINKLEIELYKVDTDLNGNETYTLLKFAKEVEFINEDNYLKDIDINNLYLQYDNSYVNNTLNITLDNNIETKIVCTHIIKDEADQDQIFDTFDLCKNTRQKYSTNELYKITIDKATGEVC